MGASCWFRFLLSLPLVPGLSSLASPVGRVALVSFPSAGPLAGARFRVAARVLCLARGSGFVAVPVLCPVGGLSLWLGSSWSALLACPAVPPFVRGLVLLRPFVSLPF